MLCVCIGLLAMLGAIQLKLLGDGVKVRPLVTVTIFGGLLCLAAGLARSTLLLLTAIAFCVVVAVATAIALHGEPRSHLRKLLSVRSGRSGLGPTLTFAAGLLLLVGAGVAFGVLLTREGGKEPADAVAISSPYRVSGTCVNGACTVNECTTTVPCGKENKGELHEGTPLDIVCQTRGGIARAPNGRKSQIWDRLESGLYISDLFVEGTARSRFASHLVRCAEA